MKKYEAPGVYVSELNSFPNTVVQVPTSVAVFVGYTETAIVDGKDVTGIPVVQAMEGPMRVAPEDPGGTLADQAADRCMNFSTLQVDLRLSQVGAGVGDLRVQALDVGVQRIDLLALALRIGLGLGDLRARDAAVGGHGRHLRFRDEPRRAQFLQAGQVELRTTQRRLIGLHLSVARGNQARLLSQLALRLQALGFTRREGRLRTLDGQPEVVGFQTHQQLTFFDVLIVLHQYLGDARA